MYRRKIYLFCVFNDCIKINFDVLIMSKGRRGGNHRIEMSWLWCPGYTGNH